MPTYIAGKPFCNRYPNHSPDKFPEDRVGSTVPQRRSIPTHHHDGICPGSRRPRTTGPTLHLRAQQDSSLGFGRYLHDPDHCRSRQTSVGHEDQVNRARISTTVDALSRRNRFPRLHGIRRPDRDKSFDPDLIVRLSHRN